MTGEIHLRCTCGALRGVIQEVSPKQANRNICGCRGCRDYARQLGREEEILDAWGGTEVFQVSPRRVKLLSGLEHLACMQLTPKGALRWYASCCQTPLAHTQTSGPFLAINHLAVDRQALEAPLEELVGPIRATVNSAFRGEEKREHKAGVAALLGMLWHFMPIFLGWQWRGDAKASPFVDAQGQPICEVEQRWEAAELKPRRAGCG